MHTENIRGKYAISADSFARAVAFAISQPEDVDINEILFRRRGRNSSPDLQPGARP